MSDNWRDSAACAGADTEEFYAIDTGGRPAPNGYRPAQPAVTVYCRPCPVRTECLEWALDTGEKHGVLGGLTPEQRAGLKRSESRRRAKAVAREPIPLTAGVRIEAAPGGASTPVRGPDLNSTPDLTRRNCG